MFYNRYLDFYTSNLKMETNILNIEYQEDSTAENTFNNLHLKDIPILSSSSSYEYFFNNFMSKNIPCIIQNVADDWNATINWISGNKPDFTYLRTKYDQYEVTVYDCNTRYFNSNEIMQCRFNQYLDYWQNMENKTVSSSKQKLQYLKDWHLKQQCPNDDFYQVPKFFASDWLNEYLVDNDKDDYQFVYMGPEHTWTPFHADVFMSFSWSVNVCGKKKWILLPPGEEKKLMQSPQNFHFDITEKLDNVVYYEIMQNTGEGIFVPSGWYHQVWNLDNTISINHNWFNGCNIETIWKTLADNLNLVKKEIEDCKDMEHFAGECQKLLNVSHGMDFHTFFDLLRFITLKRISMIQTGSSETMFNGYSLSKNHAVYDIKRCASILKEFVRHEDFNELDFPISPKPEELFEDIICRTLESVVL